MMSTTTFGDCTDTSPLDPTKHVNFVQGMVLGVADFRQEFAWHAGRHEMIARDLVGYGTVSGLGLAIDPDTASATPGITVEPGIAVTPCGRFVSIKRRQCANLGEWLGRSENRARLAALEEMRGSPGTRGARVYVRLRYRDCATDDVPIPGEPCRTEEEAMAASRIADSWRLYLSFDAPAQHEEDAVRKLVHWLRRIPIVEHSAATASEVVQALRAAAATTLASSAAPPMDLELADPPVGLVIGRDDLCECLRAVLLVWTTELRGRVQEPFAQTAPGCGCSSDTSGSPPAATPGEEDLLLAELWVPLREAGAGGSEFDSSELVELHQERRPYVLHLRMVQELVTCGPNATAAAIASFASVLATGEDALLVWLHHPVELDLSRTSALAVAVNEASVTDFVVAGVPGAGNVFEIRFTGSPPIALRRGDRIRLSFNVESVVERATGRSLRQALDQSQRVYLDWVGDAIIVRAMVGLLTLDDLVDADTAGASNDDVLTFRDGLWKPEPVELSLDDLSDVDTPAPTDGQVLTFRGGGWCAEAPVRKLDDLDDVSALTPADGQFLKFDGVSWVPADVPVTSPTPVHSGVVNFKTVAAGSSGWFGPFQHGFGERMVMIRLGFETPNDPPLEFAEDTDSAFDATAPRIVVGYNAGSAQFLIFLQDPRKVGLPIASYRIRWFALPVTQLVDKEVDAKPFDFRRSDGPFTARLVAAGLVLAEVTAGNARVAGIAQHLGVAPAAIQPVLKELQAKGLIQVNGESVTLVTANG